MQQTALYQLTETSIYMMAFVVVTKNNNAIVIDGGRPEDMPLLKEYVAGRHISAWILTHAHEDHISGFVSEFRENGGKDFDIEKIYYHFPPIEILDNRDVPDYQYYQTEILEMLPEFNRVLPQFQDKVHIVTQGYYTAQKFFA